ncbi:hypothetical protein CDIK_2717 [Cucumispora dikerogammari]|nr:hypothetical protein CDIK_2717 [Cucumispora dikerogammari]
MSFSNKHFSSPSDEYTEIAPKKNEKFCGFKKRKENVNSTKEIFKIEKKQTKKENKDAFEIEVSDFLASDIPLEHNLSLSENEKIYELGIRHKNLRLKEYILFRDTKYLKYNSLNDILTFFFKECFIDYLFTQTNKSIKAARTSNKKLNYSTKKNCMSS